MVFICEFEILVYGEFLFKVLDMAFLLCNNGTMVRIEIIKL